jgi:MFS family permease
VAPSWIGRAAANAPPSARRNLIALTGASFIGFAGFTVVMPFLPLYMRQLGVTDVGEIALWTGLSLGITPAITALLSPAWGRFADRFGRKILVVRSLVSFIFLMSAMAWATHPWHIFALRAFQGLFAGYGALCLTMAADSAPPGRMAQSIGIVQTAQRLGPAVGPVIGGTVAAVVGLRASFYVTAAFYAVALVQLIVLYREPAGTHQPSRDGGGRVTFASVLAFDNFLLLMGMIFAFQLVDRSFGPVLPLHVAALGVRDGKVAFVSGVIFSILACAAALGHHFCGAVLRRWSARHVISRATLLAAAAVALFAVVPRPWLLGPVAAIFGIGLGAAMTAAYTVAATAVPAEVRGAGFGFLTSSSLTGMALSPVLSGFVAATDLRLVFGADAVVLCGVALAVRRLMLDERRASSAPATEDV